MSGSYFALKVIFERDIYEGELEFYINALKMMKNVVGVVPEEVDALTYSARYSHKVELRKEIIDAIDRILGL